MCPDSWSTGKGGHVLGGKYGRHRDGGVDSTAHLTEAVHEDDWQPRDECQLRPCSTMRLSSVWVNITQVSSLKTQRRQLRGQAVPSYIPSDVTSEAGSTELQSTSHTCRSVTPVGDPDAAACCTSLPMKSLRAVAAADLVCYHHMLGTDRCSIGFTGGEQSSS